MNNRIKGILKWLGWEALILALLLVGPIRAGADFGTTIAVLLMMHSYQIFQIVKRLDYGDA